MGLPRSSPVTVTFIPGPMDRTNRKRPETEKPAQMKSVEPSAPVAVSRRRLRTSLFANVFLFLANALVVVWQNSRLAVLWDLSYTLENSYRISLGDIPYRDFPFAHAPLTFLMQAAIIKLTGRLFWHHVAYCAIVSGLSTVLTWRI